MTRKFTLQALLALEIQLIQRSLQARLQSGCYASTRIRLWKQYP